MSNPDRLRGFYEAVAAGELDRAAEVFTPDIEIRTRLESHSGIAAVKRMLSEAFSQFDATLEIQDISEPVPGTVIVAYRLGMRGEHSGIQASQDVVDVAHLRNGSVYLVEVFSSLEEARASLPESNGD